MKNQATRSAFKAGYLLVLTVILFEELKFPMQYGHVHTSETNSCICAMCVLHLHQALLLDTGLGPGHLLSLQIAGSFSPPHSSQSPSSLRWLRAMIWSIFDPTKTLATKMPWCMQSTLVSPIPELARIHTFGPSNISPRMPARQSDPTSMQALDPSQLPARVQQHISLQPGKHRA